MKWSIIFSDIFFRNWQAKVACILFALLFFIFYNVYAVSDRTFLIPITYRTVPYLTLSNSFVSEINITIRGKENILSNIRPTDFSALISAENLVEEGTYTLPVLIVMHNPSYIREIQYTPEISSLSITLERKAITLVPVIPQLTDSLKEAYTLKEVTLSPSTVPIEGPNSLISHIQQVFTEPISLKGRLESFSQTVKLSLPETISALESPSVLLKANIEPKREMISADNIPIKPINQSPIIDIIGVIPTGWITSYFDKGESDWVPLTNEIFNTATLVVDLLGVDQSGSYTLPVQLLTSEQNKTFLFGPLSVMVNVRRGR